MATACRKLSRASERAGSGRNRERGAPERGGVGPCRAGVDEVLENVEEPRLPSPGALDAACLHGFGKRAHRARKVRAGASKRFYGYGFSAGTVDVCTLYFQVFQARGCRLCVFFLEKNRNREIHGGSAGSSYTAAFRSLSERAARRDAMRKASAATTQTARRTTGMASGGEEEGGFGAVVFSMLSARPLRINTRAGRDSFPVHARGY